MLNNRKLLVAKARKRLPDIPFGGWLYKRLHCVRPMVGLREASFRSDDVYEFIPAVEAGEPYAAIPHCMQSDVSATFQIDESKPHCDEAGIHQIKGGSLYTDCLSEILVFDHEGQVISELSSTLTPNGEDLDNLRSRTCLVPYSGPAELIGGASFSLLVGGGGGNYFHWMVDALPRLHLLLKTGLLESVDQFFVSDFSKAFQRESLALFGIREDQVRLSLETHHFQSDRLMLPDQVRGSQQIAPWIIDFYEHEFIPRITSTESPVEASNAPKRIYISRRDAGKRGVTNEAVVDALLRKYDIVSVELSELSLVEQVRLFRHVELVISPHGASLTNLLFCRKGTRVIEIFHASYIAQMYCEISQYKKLSHHYLVCGRDDAEGVGTARIHRSQAADIRIDLVQLESIVKSVISGMT